MPESEHWRLFFYQDSHQRLPVQDWLKGLNTQDEARVFQYFELLKEFGLQLKEPYTRHLHEKIWELRIPSGGSAYRVLYFAAPDGVKRFILVHAFTKTTRKTPKREIKIAVERYEDWLHRNKEK